MALIPCLRNIVVYQVHRETILVMAKLKGTVPNEKEGRPEAHMLATYLLLLVHDKMTGR